MYQSIYMYAKKNVLATEKNKKKIKVCARILLEEDGTYKTTEVYDKKAKKKDLCPYIGTLYAQSIYSNIICEKMGSVLYGAGKPDEAISDTKYMNGYNAWRTIMSEGAENDGILSTINSFLCVIEKDNTLRDSIYKELKDQGVKPEDFISFRIGKRDAEKQTSWEPWFDEWIERHSVKEETGNPAVSCITGEIVTPLRNKPFAAIRTKQTGTGSYLASYGFDSQYSYGIKDNRGTPMSEQEGETIKAGLEHLLESDGNHNDAFGIIYWYEGKETDILGPRLQDPDEKKSKKEKKKERLIRDKEAEYTAALKRFMAETGEVVNKHRDAAFHIMKFQIPDKGRFYVSGEEESTYGKLYDSVSLWLSDSEVERPIWNRVEEKWTYGGSYKAPAGNLYKILVCLLNNRDTKNKFDQIKKEYGNDRYELLKAMIFGTQVPKDIFYRAVNEATRQMLSNGNVSFVAIQVIKTYLTRMERTMERTDKTNEVLENLRRARSFGRFFAIVEEMQYESSDRRTMAKRYSGAKNCPQQAAQTLTDLAIHYVDKMRSNNKSKTADLLMSDYNEARSTMQYLPRKYTIEEKGAFDLGYAEQNTKYLIARQERIRTAMERRGNTTSEDTQAASQGPEH